MSRFCDDEFNTADNRSHRNASAWISPSDAYHMQFDGNSQTNLSRRKKVPFSQRIMLWFKGVIILCKYVLETDPEKQKILADEDDELYLKRLGLK